VKTAAESLNFRQSLLEFLEAGPGQEEKLLEEFERRKKQGDPLYSSLLYLLTHLNFTERQAARHWKKVMEHRDTLRATIGRDPGLRVAILDYFVNVSHELKNPKVIELAIYERTERSAVTDGLTGLYNHQFFLQALRQELLRSKRHGLRAALLLLDLDNFKRVNDERGHVEGDRVLMRAAAVVREGVREIDVAARYGGEEFAVLLPACDLEHARLIVDRLRTAMPAEQTCSAGVAEWDGRESPEAVIRRADEALYAAKAAGRDRTTIAA
jgi:diguanylate cyclase (GGDEF)-like protein